MPETLIPASWDQVQAALAKALADRKAAHPHEGEVVAGISGRYLADELVRAGFVVMQRPPVGGFAHLGRGAK
jgi:hypothetical protein